MVMPFLARYVQDLGVTDVADVALWSGLTLGVTPAVSAMCAPVWGRIGDRFGNKLLLMRALAAFAVPARGTWGKRRFLEAVGFGTIAAAIAHAKGKDSKPKSAKTLGIDMGREELQEHLHEAEALRFEVEVDGEVFAGEFLLVEILNISRTGPALPMSFLAEPDDGQLDIVFLFKNDRAPMLKWLEDPEGQVCPATVRRGRKVRLKWQHGHARIDDRVYVPPKSASTVKIAIEEKSFNVLVPERDES